jgi:hypothetical protein
VDPLNVLVDHLETAAGSVMRLAQVLFEHTLAEAGFIPGYFLALYPGLGDGLSFNDFYEVHSVFSFIGNGMNFTTKA